MMTELDLTYVDQTVQRHGGGADSLIPILRAIQEHYGYLPRAALRRVGELTEITPATIAGVSTFYGQFRHHPVGRHIIRVCHGAACHVKGAERVQESLERRLKIAPGDDTDAAGQFTIEKVACLGCCTLAPVVQIDGVAYGNLSPLRVNEAVDDFLARPDAAAAASGLAARADAQGPLGEVRIGLGSCCVAQGSGKVYEAVRAAIAASGARAVVKPVGCVGMCHQTPLVELTPAGGGPGKLFAKVQAESAADIVLSQFRPRGVVRRIGYAISGWLDRLHSDEHGDPVLRHAIDVRDGQVCAFLGRQRPVATEYGGQLAPTDLDEYTRFDGFEALRHCLERLSPDEIIAEIRESGLRGRGGAGFPTGLKWAAAPRPGGKKYIICNGDEGDPGAFMDRMLLESFPYRVIEGVAIAARAVGADEGIFYIRAEYPLAVKRVEEAIRQCRARGLLGEGIFGSDFRLDLCVKEGAGAFVCGEETALLAALEGRRGTPRIRPPYPAERGLWGLPTSINNVETYALVPWIFRHGAKAFSSLGTAESKGTKVFSLAGKIRRGGLIEVPMGVTLRQIVEEIGGGVAGGKRFKAVQIGGPSGGCVPAELRRHARRLRGPRRSRRDHGLRRPGRARRRRLHGRHRPLLSRLHPAAIVREVHPLPHRHAADARRARPDLRRPGQGRGPGRAGIARPRRRRRQRLRTRPHGAEPGALHAAIFPRRVRGAPRRAMSGGQVQGPGRLPHQRSVHRLHALRPALPSRGDSDDALPAARNRLAKMHPLRRLPPDLSDWRRGHPVPSPSGRGLG